MTRTVRPGSSPRLAGDLAGYDPERESDGFYFDEAAADKACGFFEECLTHVKGKLAGKPFKLEPWQRDIVRNLFGWLDDDGKRRYRECFIFVPRKNGKSLLASGICNYMLFVDDEPGAEIYCAAAERDQAALVFEVAKEQVLREPVLKENCKVYHRSIVRGPSYFKPISAEANTKHGYNPHCIVVDELHAQKDRELVDVLVTAMGAREQPLLVYITTSDYQRPNSICNEKHDYATKVRDGIIPDPAFLPVIYEASTDDEWTDPKVWAKANPNLGVSVSEEWLARECLKAQKTPAYENTFKRLHLNIRTEQDIRWLSMEGWDACTKGDPKIPKGAKCYGGLDLGTVSDLSAFVLLFPDYGNAVKCWFWAPRESAERREKEERVPYLTWARQDLMKLTDGRTTDIGTIRNDILDLCKVYDVKEIACDPFQARQMMQELSAEGLTIIEFHQRLSNFAGPCRELERLIGERAIEHGGNQILRWMASNVCVKTDSYGNMRPDRKSSTEKIDGIVSLLMAMGRAGFGVDTTSVYQTRGLKTL